MPIASDSFDLSSSDLSFKLTHALKNIARQQFSCETVTFIGSDCPTIDINEFVKRHKKFIGWQFIYCIAFNYPVMKSDLSKVRYNGHIAFFKSLEHIINDKKCITFLEKNSITDALLSRDTFTKWVYSLEKYVKNGKCCTYDTKCRMFEKHRVEKCKDGTCRI
jgi:hypothetical protein